MIRKLFYCSQDLKSYLDAQHGWRYALAYFPDAPELGEALYFSNDLQTLLTKAVGFAENDVSLIEVRPGLWAAENLDYPLEPFNAVNRGAAMAIFWEQIAEAVRDEGFEALLFEKQGRSLEHYYQEWQILESVRINHELIRESQENMSYMSDFLH